MQLELARVADETLECEVSPTTQDAEEKGSGFKAKLRIKGFSNAPAVQDEEKGGWLNLKNEPLFVIGKPSGNDASELEVPLMLMHRVYHTPTLTNIMIGSLAIGTNRDEAFSLKYQLSYYPSQGIKSFKRHFKINGDLACTVIFGKDKKWAVQK